MSLRPEPGTPLAAAITAAAQALQRSDAAGVDAAYQAAMGLADADAAPSVARDHVSCLVRLHAYSLARKRCGEHTATFPQDRALLLSRAETHLAVADFTQAVADAESAERLDGALSTEERARVRRIRGLAAADRSEHDVADEHLAQARALFDRAGHRAGVAMADRDRQMLRVRQGEPQAVAAALSAERPESTADRLVLAWALKRELRYEEALNVLPDAESVDPALRTRVLAEKVVLLGLTRQDDDADHIAAAEPDLFAEGSPRFDQRLRLARLLVIQATQALSADTVQAATLARQAESIIIDLRGDAKSDSEVATWHLAAGELEIARHGLLDLSAAPDAALRDMADGASGHFRVAARRAACTPLAEVRMLALRHLGHARLLVDVQAEAVEHWQAAHRIEEDIVDRQVGDDIKVRMLLAASDEHDELVKAAAATVDRHGPGWIAPVVVAMESARGRTIVDALRDVPVRDTPLPAIGDLTGACGWLRELSHDLPRSTMIWMIHATPHRVHHAMIGRDKLLHWATPERKSFRDNLYKAVRALTALWTRKELERSVVSGTFDRRLDTLSALLDLGNVIDKVPGDVTRIAVVANGCLSQVPMAALPIPGTPDRLVHRFALSDLACLSARRSLARRSGRRRGDRSLLVRPTATDLTQARKLSGRTQLTGDDADLQALRVALAGRPKHHILRIDGHGRFGDDPWLQLAPDDEPGRLRPAELRAMDLRACGTAVLGACESGMAQLIGRDERVGFVRAALHAGAASVVAARWIAEDPVAADVLDAFDRYLRYLPRDVALQRAQLAIDDHPARWACWTLYGDPGWQTSAGPIRRLLRGALDDRRRRADQN